MNIYDVTFETKCYEKDWEIMLKTNRIERMINYNSYEFKEKILYINNVNNIKEVEGYAKKLVETNILTSYVIVEDYAEEALKFFNIEKESFKGGYYYSIEELVGIYLCKTPYILHFSSDAMPEKKMSWINEAIEALNASTDIKVANLTWNKKYNQAKSEAITINSSYYIGQGFSDQCYLIKVQDFKNPIFSEENIESDRYPKYGGELFEKRVDSWMRNNKFKRITCKDKSYIHKNYPKNKIMKKLYLIINRK